MLHFCNSCGRMYICYTFITVSEHVIEGVICNIFCPSVILGAEDGPDHRRTNNDFISIDYEEVVGARNIFQYQYLYESIFLPEFMPVIIIKWRL